MDIETKQLLKEIKEIQEKRCKQEYQCQNTIKAFLITLMEDCDMMEGFIKNVKKLH